MKNKTTTAIGIFLLVFLFVIAAALSASALQPKNVDAASVEEYVQVQATLAAYEAQQQAYDELIQQANEQLANANATFAALAVSADTQPTESAGLSPEEAVALAQTVAIYPDTQVGTPELVLFEGTVAYEVKYAEGAIYISFATGEILLNGTVTLTDEITIAEAQQIAQNYLGLSSIYLADVVTVNGVELYRIIFTAGHFVYIDHFGQIIYVQMNVQGDLEPTRTITVDDDDPSPTPTPHEEEEEDDDDDEHEEEDD